MKKIILIFTVFLLTACYDYVEINDLSFISCIGIDYEDDAFKLTYEIINDTKQSQDGSSQEGYTISGSGKTLATAFDNISLKVTKNPYFSHLKAMVISEDIAKSHMKEVIEYVTRNPNIRNEFYLAIAKDVKASDIVKSANKNNPIIGNQITQIIDSNVDFFNITYAKAFEDILERFLNDKTDPIVSVITLANDDLKTLGIGIFKEFEYIDTLTKEHSAYLNLLLKEPLNMILAKKYYNKDLAINIYDGNTDIKINDNNITINITVEGEIRENMPEFDLRKEETYIKLSKDFSKKLKNDINELINLLKTNDTDVIGLENLYYKKYRKENKHILNNSTIYVNANVIVNKKGLIFEVPNE